ncbi:nucleotidyltransferase domain protein [Mycobacterium xenopi 3993]|nr:nucleotidyltransferase domain protein [Mycobacterium xenopi 3993]
MRIGRDAKPVEDVASPHRPNGDETIPDMSDVATRIAEAVEALRCHGAAFAYLHGSRANNTARPTSDVDIAAYFGGQRPPAAFEVLLPAGVDLLVLDNAPLELAGKVALHGTLLFEKDPPTRVAWEATTRKIYFDELRESLAPTRSLPKRCAVVDEARVLRLLRGITDDVAILRRESAAGRPAGPTRYGCAASSTRSSRRSRLALTLHNTSVRRKVGVLRA